MFWPSRRALMKKLTSVENFTAIMLEELAAMSAAMDHLKASVEAQKEVTEGVAVLLGQLSQQLKDAVAAGDMSAVEEVAKQIDSNTDQLKDAVVANTPHAPPAEEPAPAPVVVEPAPVVVVEPAPAPVVVEEPAPAPVVEEPPADAPAPVADAPVADAPVVDAPVTDAPVSEPPQTP